MLQKQDCLTCWPCGGPSTHQKGVIMRKSVKTEPRRILARVLAEDLRNIQVTGAAATTSQTGKRGQDDWDLTNVGGDGDVMEL